MHKKRKFRITIYLFRLIVTLFISNVHTFFNFFVMYHPLIVYSIANLIVQIFL